MANVCLAGVEPLLAMVQHLRRVEGQVVADGCDTPTTSKPGEKGPPRSHHITSHHITHLASLGARRTA